MQDDEDDFPEPNMGMEVFESEMLRMFLGWYHLAGGKSSLCGQMRFAQDSSIQVGVVWEESTVRWCGTVR